MLLPFVVKHRIASSDVETRSHHNSYTFGETQMAGIEWAYSGTRQRSSAIRSASGAALEHAPGVTRHGCKYAKRFSDTLPSNDGSELHPRLVGMA